MLRDNVLAMWLRFVLSSTRPSLLSNVAAAAPARTPRAAEEPRPLRRRDPKRYAMIASGAAVLGELPALAPDDGDDASLVPNGLLARLMAAGHEPPAPQPEEDA